MCPCYIPREKEKKTFVNAFIIFTILQSIVILILCSLAITIFSSTNISSFLPVDILTLLIAVIILSILLIVIGVSAAISNTGIVWIVFHCCMAVLFLIEIVVSVATANTAGFVSSITSIWNQAEDTSKCILETDLHCTGLTSPSDQPALGCGDASSQYSTGCLLKLTDLLNKLRTVSSVSLFVVLIFGLYLDFVGCVICYHPDTLTLEEHEKEQATIVAQEIELEYHTNPFQI